MAERAYPHAHQHVYSHHDIYSGSADRYPSAGYRYGYRHGNGYAYVYPIIDVYPLPHTHHYPNRHVYGYSPADDYADKHARSADGNVYHRPADADPYPCPHVDGRTTSAWAAFTNADQQTVRMTIHA